MIKAYLYSADPEHCSADKWDYGLLKQTFERNNTEQVRVTELPETDRAFVIIPGPQNKDFVDKINTELSKIGRVVLFLTGDEERVFPVNKISHPNIVIWVNYIKEHEVDMYHSLPIGTPQRIKDYVPAYPEKIYDVYFGGQITHTRRKDVAKVMPTMRNALFSPTEGFAQGNGPEQYYKDLASAKFCPAPAGTVVVDTFRFFEALEMLTLPIGDLVNSAGKVDTFMIYALGSPPVPMVINWHDLQGVIDEYVTDYHSALHNAVAWWIKYKRDLSFKIMEHVNG